MDVFLCDAGFSTYFFAVFGIPLVSRMFVLLVPFLSMSVHPLEISGCMELFEFLIPILVIDHYTCKPRGIPKAFGLQ
jgi:hypothetical protein